jgi:hypothetical protein
VRKPYIELTFEFLIEILLFAYPYGAEQMNLPHNFWLGLITWLIATAIGVRMFWIFPLWNKRLSHLEKALICTIVVGVFVLVLYRPVMAAYKKRNGEMGLADKATPAVLVPQPNPRAPSIVATTAPKAQSAAPKRARLSSRITQDGNGNTANPGNIDNSHFHLEPCAVFQNGGSNNSANPSCLPPERKLSAEHRKAFVDTLRPACPFIVPVHALLGNPEASRYSDQIMSALREAGCNPSIPNNLAFGKLVWPISAVCFGPPLGR